MSLKARSLPERFYTPGPHTADALIDRIFALTSAILGSGRGDDCVDEITKIDIAASDLRALVGKRRE